ncbi:MAG TPA: hypothetical protein VNL34_03400 [Candidatus Nitrosotenuis sp.]|nr:hypothetical protein [Candidatus Nitrosotenuis sp.]
MKQLLTAALLAMLMSGSMSAFAAQLSWDARSPDGAVVPKFTFQRTFTIEYDGGIIADELRGKQTSVQFSADGSTKGMEELVQKINEDLQKSGSTVWVSDATLQYSAELIGRERSATIDYKITLVPTISGFLIREYEQGSPALFDANWRGIKVDGEVVLSDSQQEIEINRPVSFLQTKFPAIYDVLEGTDAAKLLESSLMDASGIKGLSIAKWHSLTDPTAIISDTSKYGFKGDVLTAFSMGESNIFTPTKEKFFEATLIADKEYKVQMHEAADSANLFVPGYAASTMIGEHEAIGASPTPLYGTPRSQQGQFPVYIIYGMSGMAAAGAGGFFWWSNKKAKKDLASGQSGIDPSLLRGIETSSASGAYKTNRGEAHLVGNSIHEQTKSVYDLQIDRKKTMPKGWPT